MHKNLPKEKLLAEIERLKKELKKKKKYGLVWEEKPEEVVEMCKEKLPVLKEVKNNAAAGGSFQMFPFLPKSRFFSRSSVFSLTNPSFLDAAEIGRKSWPFL